MAQKWARSFGGRGTRSFANLAKIEIFPKRRLDTCGSPPIGIGWLKNSLLCTVEVPWLNFGWFWNLFFWPKIFSKAMAWNREFWLKTLSGSSGAHQTQTELRKSQGWNLLHEYPKVMPNWDRGDKPDLSYFEKMQKKIFLRFEAPKNVKFLDIFIQT